MHRFLFRVVSSFSDAVSVDRQVTSKLFSKSHPAIHSRNRRKLDRRRLLQTVMDQTASKLSLRSFPPRPTIISLVVGRTHPSKEGIDCPAAGGLAIHNLNSACSSGAGIGCILPGMVLLPQGSRRGRRKAQASSSGVVGSPLKKTVTSLSRRQIFVIPPRCNLRQRILLMSNRLLAQL